MVFANLNSSEKDAFFSLLDEYFSSRPDLLKNLDSENTSIATSSTGRAAASAIHNAFASSNPSPEPSIPSWKRPSNANTPSASNTDVSSSVGRVAAAAAAFKFNPAGQNNDNNAPRPPPRRAASNTSEPEAQQPPAHAERSPSTAGRLATQKKFGDVDLTSGKNMFMSLRHSTANKTAVPSPVAPPIAPAFAPKKNQFAPPPVRRVTSSSSQAAESPAASPPPPPPPRVREEEPEGEWAEALYDYSSEDPGDLPIQEGERVLIVEKTSEDWWTGELNGKKGLVPASYVKLL